MSGFDVADSLAFLAFTSGMFALMTVMVGAEVDGSWRWFWFSLVVFVVTGFLAVGLA